VAKDSGRKEVQTAGKNSAWVFVNWNQDQDFDSPAKNKYFGGLNYFSSSISYRTDFSGSASLNYVEKPSPDS
jgi:hypothetical protein